MKDKLRSRFIVLIKKLKGFRVKPLVRKIVGMPLYGVAQHHIQELYKEPSLDLSPEERQKFYFMRLAKKVLFFILLPTFVSALYYLFFMSQFYQSRTQFVILSANQKMPSSILDSLIGGVITPSLKDSFVVRDYLLSQNTLNTLKQEHHFMDTFQDKSIDFFSRLPINSDAKEELDYYQGKVSIEIDSHSGITTLKVLAPVAEGAQNLAKTLLKLAEQKVNDLSRRYQKDQIRFAEQQLQHAQDKFFIAQERVLQYQKDIKDLDPKQSISGIYTIKGSLEAKLAIAKAKLSELEKYMHEDSFQVQSLQNKIESLKEQIKNEKNILVDRPYNNSLNKNFDGFIKAELERNFAEKNYQASMAFLEKAKVDILQQTRYLATVVEPTLDDIALYPNPWIKVGTVFLLLLVAYMVLSLSIMAIREHLKV